MNGVKDITNDNYHKIYFEELCTFVDSTLMWRSLREKYEYGSNTDEMVFQLRSRQMARKIARGLNMNEYLADFLTACRGSFFPCYGKQGKKVIMEYFAENKIDIGESELAIGYVKRNLERVGGLISIDGIELDSYLAQLFDDSEEPKTEEVKLAKFCGDTMDIIKSLVQQLTDSSKITRINQLVKAQEDACLSSEKLVVCEEINKLRSINDDDSEVRIPQNLKDKIVQKLDLYFKKDLTKPYDCIELSLDK